MVGTFIKRHKRVTIAATIVSALLALVTVLTIDGEMYERWIAATELKRFRNDWIKDGRPEPTTWKPFSWEARHATISIHIQTYRIEHREYTTLFAYDSKKHPLAITANGEILLRKRDGAARTIWMHPTRGGAW